MATRKDESGVILLAFLFFIVLLVFGYVVINSISKSREADKVRESASEVIDSAQDTVDQVNSVRNQAEDIVN